MNKIINLTEYNNWLIDRNRAKFTIRTYNLMLKIFYQNKKTINTSSIREFLKENIFKYQVNSLRNFRQALSSYTKFSKITIDWERI